MAGFGVINPSANLSFGVINPGANLTFGDISSTSAPGSVEKVVRSFVTADLLVSRLVKLRPKDGEGAEAEAIWGKASNFSVLDVTEKDDGGVAVIVNWPKDDTSLDGFEVDVPTLEFEEFHRTVTVVRIENPDDSDQYVMVERIDDITFKGPDLRPADAATGIGKGDGSSIFSPFILGDIAPGPSAESGQLDSKGLPKTFRFPYIFYKFILHNTRS